MFRKKLISVKEAAAILNVTSSQIFNLIRIEKLRSESKTHRGRKRTLVYREDVEDYNTMKDMQGVGA